VYHGPSGNALQAVYEELCALLWSCWKEGASSIDSTVGSWRLLIKRSPQHFAPWSVRSAWWACDHPAKTKDVPKRCCPADCKLIYSSETLTRRLRVNMMQLSSWSRDADQSQNATARDIPDPFRTNDAAMRTRCFFVRLLEDSTGPDRHTLRSLVNK